VLQLQTQIQSPHLQTTTALQSATDDITIATYPKRMKVTTTIVAMLVASASSRATAARLRSSGMGTSYFGVSSRGASSNGLVQGIPMNGTATTTRYYDCSCPVCAGYPCTGNTLTHQASDSGTNLDDSQPIPCQDGSYASEKNANWCTPDSGCFGTVAASDTFGIGSGGGWSCGACYSLTDTDGSLDIFGGNSFIVMITNSCPDSVCIGQNHFDIAIPVKGAGGGQDKCSSAYPGYFDESSESGCDAIPNGTLRVGCEAYENDMGAFDNPTVAFTQVECPSELLERFPATCSQTCIPQWTNDAYCSEYNLGCCAGSTCKDFGSYQQCQ